MLEKLINSGSKYPGVPHLVNIFLESFLWTARPKSAMHS
jgi:hypothetical protein